MTECPKCHYVRLETDVCPDWQCPACGIVYEKFTQQVVQASIKTANNKKHHKKKWTLSTVTIIAGITTFVVLLLKNFNSRTGISDIAMAVVFYISSVPVLSALFGDGLYVWNKHVMRFELYQSEKDWVVKLVTVISFVLLIAVTVLLFWIPTPR